MMCRSWSPSSAFPSRPARRSTCRPSSKGLRRLAYNLWWSVAPAGPDAVQPDRRRRLGALPQPDPRPVRSRRTGTSSSTTRRSWPSTRRSCASSTRYMANGADHWFARQHGDRARRPDRLLLRRVRLPRVARDLLRRPRRPRRRPHEDRLGHGPAARRRRPDVPQRLLPPDDRRGRPPGARLPGLRARRGCRSCGRSTGWASRSRVSVPLPGRDLYAAVWVAQVGRVPVLLLDTDVPDNDDSDRPITHILYVRGREMRLHQELVLGVGGVRALRELGLDAGGLAPQRGPLGVPARRAGARARRVGPDAGRGLDARPARRGVHDPHPGLGGQRAVRRGPRAAGRRPRSSRATDARTRAASRSTGCWSWAWAPRATIRQFDMTAFSLRLTRGANAVSACSTRETANATWQGVMPHRDPRHHERRPHADLGRPADARRIRALLERGPRRAWTSRPRSAASGSGSTRSPREELWEAHQRQKLELAIFARGRLRSQFARHGEAPTTLEELEEVLDPSILTIGFARRFATYKRAALLFTDIDRLARAAVGRGAAGPDHLRRQGASRRPARPGRDPGHLRPVAQPAGSAAACSSSRTTTSGSRRFLVQGVDVWLNNPRRPLEASGTSRHEGGGERRPQPVASSTAGGTRAGPATTAGRSAAARPTPTRAPRTGPTPRTCTGSSRRSWSRAYYERDTDGLPERWVAADAQRDRQHDLAVLDDPHAPRVRGAAVPAGRCAGRRHDGRHPARGRRRRRDRRLLIDRRRARPRAGSTEVRPWPPASRSPSRSTTTSRWATSAGCSPRSTTRRTCRCSRRWSATRASASRSTTRVRCSSGSPPSARSSSPGSARSWRAARSSCSGGGLYEPILASLPERDRVAQLSRMAGELEADHGPPAAGRLARRARLGAGPAHGARRRRLPAGRSSTTSTSAPRRSPRRTCGARTRPRTRATC